MKPTLFQENERARSFCTYGIIGMILLLVAASLVYGDHRESNDLPREIIFAVRQLGRGPLCRRKPHLPLRSRHGGAGRGNAGRLPRKGAFRHSRSGRARLASSGHSSRTALPAPRRSALLLRSESDPSVKRRSPTLHDRGGDAHHGKGAMRELSTRSLLL